jgi:hypothetical protein
MPFGVPAGKTMGEVSVKGTGVLVVAPPVPVTVSARVQPALLVVAPT